MADGLPQTTRVVIEESYIMEVNYSWFDLDMVLTGADDLSNEQAIPEPPLVVVADFPTVVGRGKCAICLRNFEGEGGKEMPCGHVYHETCISPWLSLNHTCPYCRRRISARAA